MSIFDHQPFTVPRSPLTAKKVLKSRIYIILPIAIAAIMPGLGYFSQVESVIETTNRTLVNWVVVSVIIYSWWYLLWYQWDLKLAYRIWWILFALIIFGGISYTGLIVFVFEDPNDFKWHFVFRMLLSTILIIGIQYALKTQQHNAQLRLEKEQIQTENYKVQIKAIRAQIDPHFLFNSLNTLRSMVRQQHPKSEKFILSLSDFYRQTLKHNENTTLPLSEELAVLESYLFLMKSRNEEAVTVNINIDDSLNPFHLPALALQIIVENCFKHNSMTSKRPLHINIHNDEDYYIVISNNIQPKIGDQEPSGYGLNLLRKRYELLKIQNGVIIEETPEQFTVKLKLVL